MRKMSKRGALICLLAMMLFTLCACGSSSSHGNGVNTCKNCGRHSVYALGYCKSCYEGFNDWMKRQ